MIRFARFVTIVNFPVLLLVLLAVCLSTSSFAKKKPVVSTNELLWEDVAKSNDFAMYAKFVELHPTDHIQEIRQLVDAFWKAKIKEGERAGKRVVYHASGVGGSLKPNMSRGLLTIGGGKPVPVFGVDLYSDPTDKLTIVLRADNSFGYLEGRGLGVASDAIYCFGF
jgi:hypothetical protein